jgi:hypothetical protein
LKIDRYVKHISIIAVEEDESIFVHDALIRTKMSTCEGMRPVVVIVTGAFFKDGKHSFVQVALTPGWVHIMF